MPSKLNKKERQISLMTCLHQYVEKDMLGKRSGLTYEFLLALYFIFLYDVLRHLMGDCAL